MIDRTPLLVAFLENVEPSSLNDVRDRLIEKHNLSDLSLTHQHKQKLIEINKIAVHPDHRGKGHARAAMRGLTAHADATGHTLALHPAPEFGASKKRLTKWYRAHGFVSNKGRNKNWATQLTMVRVPHES